MRFLAGSTVVATLLFGAQAFAQAGSMDIAGTWLTEDGRAKIRTEHCGDGSQKLCGYVVWMKDALNEKGEPRTDLANPDPAKRGRPSLGMEIMSGLKPEDPTHFEGEIYNADNGKMYNVTVSLPKQEQLEVHGCMLKFLCGSQSWTRVADIALPGTKVASTPGGVKASQKPAAAGAKILHDNSQPVK